jgi:hypothetical protein
VGELATPRIADKHSLTLKGSNLRCKCDPSGSESDLNGSVGVAALTHGY